LRTGFMSRADWTAVGGPQHGAVSRPAISTRKREMRARQHTKTRTTDSAHSDADRDACAAEEYETGVGKEGRAEPSKQIAVHMIRAVWQANGGAAAQVSATTAVKYSNEMVFFFCARVLCGGEIARPTQTNGSFSLSHSHTSNNQIGTKTITKMQPAVISPVMPLGSTEPHGE
jgi:hypothetical protein